MRVRSSPLLTVTALKDSQMLWIENSRINDVLVCDWEIRTQTEQTQPCRLLLRVIDPQLTLSKEASRFCPHYIAISPSYHLFALAQSYDRLGDLESSIWSEERLSRCQIVNHVKQ